ncbi:hypothetical protein KXV68_005557 [Aspergillus fumigatus]|nr:hypothetical protein CNMCM8714_003588 [Aspergillus fumigatus]KMK57361.1 hypothetical protein Y699_06902 [Aspergillus fumigatus Z5]KAF4259906.1 hypothetical protein CNMCM8057_002448 [Aspergillus fumigatus]KAF4264870.1 hypothetical protein CNMCM8812_003387 [Aspergillus fumigatus]KAH1335518.1 hypothetical protein KXX67_004245 [Aspergillus fumigatus]
MVTPTSKPNSSFSKVYLTKNNYAGRSLHPNAKRPGKGVEESAKEESTQVVESFEVDGDKQIVDNEDITAEPASSPVSSLEDHENEILPGFEYFDSAVGERRRPQRGRKDLRGSESPTLRRKRNADEMAHTAQADAEKEDYVFGWSQSQKKRKQGYAGKKSDGSLWKAQGSTTAPSQSKSSPSSSASESKTGSSSQKTKTRSRKEAVDRAPSFMVPPDIDDLLPSSSGNRTKPEFIASASIPNDTISSSSGFASSAQISHFFDSDDDCSSGTSLSSVPENLLEEFSQMEDVFLSDMDDSENTELKQSLCPWCKKAVDSDALRKFRAQPKQRICEQQQFCESHQKETAEKEWKERGYPDIDWDTFDERIKCHFDDLESILVPEGNSYYRNVLDTMLKSGKAKNFRLTLAGDALETICCGYYGTRGANKMLQALTARFSRKLRRLAAEDHIVKTAGPVIYAQAVLVPELAVRLVKEDMGVDVDSARQILRESIEIGEKLNFAPNDVVPIPAESENADDIIV